MDEQLIVVDFEPLTAADLIRQPTTGFVSYDPFTGAVLSATLRREADDTSPCIEVPAIDVLAFVEGSRKMADWAVLFGSDRKTLTLTPITTSEIEIVRANAPIQKVGFECGPTPVKITFQIPRHGSSIGVEFSSRDPRIILKSEAILSVILTPKAQPEAVLLHHDIELAELIRTGFARIEYEITEEIDVYVYPLLPVSFEVEAVSSVFEPLALPQGRYEDMMWFETADLEPALLMARERAYLKFRCHQGGGRRYDRTLSRLMIVLCRDHDPDQFLYSFPLDVEALLMDEMIEVELPENFAEEHFDAFTNLFFENLQIVTAEVIDEGYSVLPLPDPLHDVMWFERSHPRAGLLMSWNSDDCTISFRLHEHRCSRYSRDLTTLRIGLCRTHDLDEFLYSFELELKPLINKETIIVKLPNTYRDESFEVFAQVYFEHLIWVNRF